MMRRRQRHVRKGEALKIRPKRSCHPGHSASSFLMTLSLSSGHSCLPREKMETLSCWPKGQHQSALHQFMDNLHIFRPVYLHRAVPAQVWILMQGHTITPPRWLRQSRSGHLSSSHRLEHRAPLHRQCPLIKTHLMIILRSGAVPVGTPLMRVALSSWWPQSEHRRTTAPPDIPPSGDQKCSMPGWPMME
jgi:hypothetical protein